MARYSHFHNALAHGGRLTRRYSEHKQITCNMAVQHKCANLSSLPTHKPISMLRHTRLPDIYSLLRRASSRPFCHTLVINTRVVLADQDLAFGFKHRSRSTSICFDRTLQSSPFCNKIPTGYTMHAGLVVQNIITAPPALITTLLPHNSTHGICFPMTRAYRKTVARRIASLSLFG